MVYNRPVSRRLSKKAHHNPQGVVRAQPSSQSPKIRGVPVTVRALTQRLDRLLARDSKELRKTRGAPAIDALGSYYLLHNNSVFADPVDLEELGRKTGALADYERLLLED